MVTFTNRTSPTTSFSDRITYLVTEVFDFLMSEDNKYIITDESKGDIPNTIFSNSNNHAVSFTNKI